jgi:hypothetical protein
MNCNKPLNSEVIYSIWCRCLELSVLAIRRDTCSVVIGLCSIAVTLDTPVCSLLIQLAFGLCLTAFPQMDAQKAVKACLSGNLSWQSGRRSLFMLVIKRLFCCFLSFASLYRLSFCNFTDSFSLRVSSTSVM